MTRPTPDGEIGELRAKLRMIISHASGGHLSEPGDIDRSTNDICVEISRHKNDVWEQAQESARTALETQAADIARLREALEAAVFALRNNGYPETAAELERAATRTDVR